MTIRTFYPTRQRQFVDPQLYITAYMVWPKSILELLGSVQQIVRPTPESSIAAP